MNFRVADRDVAGPERAVIPGGSVSTRRIISLYAVVLVFRFVDAIAVNSIAATVDILPLLICVVRVRKNLEPFDNDPARQVKPNVIYDNALVCFGAYRQRLGSIVAAISDSLS